MEDAVQVRVLGPSLLREALETLLRLLPLEVAVEEENSETQTMMEGGHEPPSSLPARRRRGGRDKPQSTQVVVVIGPDWAERVQSYRRTAPRGSFSASREPRYVLVTNEQAVDFYRARRLAVSAFIGDDEPLEVLEQGIDAAAQGRSFCSPQLLPTLIDAVGQTPPLEVAGEEGTSAEPAGGAQTPFLYLQPAQESRPELSAREHQVALHAARGMSNEQIAVYLKISVPTVKYHLQRAFRKMGIERRTQLYTFLPYLTEATQALLGPAPHGEEA